jgi:hypothetical protein
MPPYAGGENGIQDRERVASMQSETFRRIALDCRARSANAEHTVRVAHCWHVAALLEEIAQKMDSGHALDSVPLSDICYAISGSMALSEIETLSLRAMGATRPMFSAQLEPRAISALRSDSHARRATAEDK